MGKAIDKIISTANVLHRCWRRLQVFVERGTPTSPVSQEETECRHCGYVFRGNFCPRCGQNRLAGKGKPRFLKTFREAYPQLSNNFTRTIVHLLSRPGYMMRDYFRGHRVIYQSPVSTFLIAISIEALFMNIGHSFAPTHFEVQSESQYEHFSNVQMKVIEESAQKDPEMKQAYNQWRAQKGKTPSTRKQIIWDVVKDKLTSNTTVALFALFPLFGVTSYGIFRRRMFYGRRLSIMEHYIIFVYLFALSSFFDLFDQTGLLTLFYLVWAYRGLFRLPWWKAFAYAFVVTLIDIVVLLLLIVLYSMLMVHMMYGFL